jgi:hypothetical protein
MIITVRCRGTGGKVKHSSGLKVLNTVIQGIYFRKQLLITLSGVSVGNINKVLSKSYYYFSRRM